MRKTAVRLRRLSIVATVAAISMIGISAPAFAATYRGWGNFPAVSGEDRIDAFPDGGAPAGKTTFCLETTDNITWWKAVIVRDWNGVELAHLFTQNGNHGRACADVELHRVMQLELWKAKAFGAHTHMYTLTITTLQERAGQKMVFRWWRD
jgi:hypothetical protein